MANHFLIGRPFSPGFMHLKGGLGGRFMGVGAPSGVPPARPARSPGAEKPAGQAPACAPWPCALGAPSVVAKRAVRALRLLRLARPEASNVWLPQAMARRWRLGASAPTNHRCTDFTDPRESVSSVKSLVRRGERLNRSATGLPTAE